ncbi:MAG: HNH endonuclease [Anaerolineales bacterium]|nr:HNH endonuclease [Anaerolineales bacterium]
MGDSTFPRHGPGKPTRPANLALLHAHCHDAAHGQRGE